MGYPRGIITALVDSGARKHGSVGVETGRLTHLRGEIALMDVDNAELRVTQSAQSLAFIRIGFIWVKVMCRTAGSGRFLAPLSAFGKVRVASGLWTRFRLENVAFGAPETAALGVF